ncbi:hypothetical protein [Mucilaginibacter aquatilis]|uniref:Magnesium citrate secondary transporter n=1 Tax=Mucilaginibacter aquatilis TaxID=1517760 RepID=A0A6I4I9D0_9SPHI|nr:hypothetical protein [Mucilaginibacter aquatilis]MVN90598.1 hypothetical protein [Mucilaginibacter aquatilis]
MNWKYWLAVLSTTGLTVYFAKKTHVALPEFVSYYLNDLLIVPLTALITRTVMRLIFGAKTLILTTGQVLYIVIFYSVIFELILPFYIQRYTADSADVMMYTLGGIFYLLIINRS